MGFSTLDDLTAEIVAGKSFKSVWQKTTGAAAYTIGRTYDFSILSGMPPANSYSGTALTWQSTDDTNIFSLNHRGNVSTDTKHVINSGIVTSAATGIGQLMLVDLQGYWPGINLNSAVAQNLSGTPTLRYTNGAGCFLYGVVTTTSGATAHNISLSYTNTVPTSGRSLPTTVAMTASAIVGHIPHSGTAANNYGPFLPLASGDLGVSNVASVTMSAASGAGVMALCLARPILTLPIPVSTIFLERDYLTQMTTLPRIVDGACLVWLYTALGATAASTIYSGFLEVAWG